MGHRDLLVTQNTAAASRQPLPPPTRSVRRASGFVQTRLRPGMTQVPLGRWLAFHTSAAGLKVPGPGGSGAVNLEANLAGPITDS
jgi:hypothetical protein